MFARRFLVYAAIGDADTRAKEADLLPVNGRHRFLPVATRLKGVIARLTSCTTLEPFVSTDLCAD